MPLDRVAPRSGSGREGVADDAVEVELVRAGVREAGRERLLHLSRQPLPLTLDGLDPELRVEGADGAEPAHRAPDGGELEQPSHQ
jgi:hypothetical protein